MKTWSFAKRNLKEIVRDPLNLLFGLGFPAVLLLLLSAIQANIPVPLFEINRLAPAMTVFGFSFMTLFSATLIARDRESALLTRLYATPMSAMQFILGYTLPLLPVALLQALVCFFIGVLLGMELTVKLVFGTLLALPAALLFVGLGLLFGSVLNPKQVGGICGALLTNLTAWLSGIWFDLELVGGAFRRVAELLPFYHGVQIEQLVFAGRMSEVLPHLLWVSGYAVAAILLAALLFLKQMKKG